MLKWCQHSVWPISGIQKIHTYWTSVKLNIRTTAVLEYRGNILKLQCITQWKIVLTGTQNKAHTVSSLVTTALVHFLGILLMKRGLGTFPDSCPYLSHHLWLELCKGIKPRGKRKGCSCFFPILFPSFPFLSFFLSLFLLCLSIYQWNRKQVTIQWKICAS